MWLSSDRPHHRSSLRTHVSSREQDFVGQERTEQLARQILWLTGVSTHSQPHSGCRSELTTWPCRAQLVAFVVGAVIQSLRTTFILLTVGTVGCAIVSRSGRGLADHRAVQPRQWGVAVVALSPSPTADHPRTLTTPGLCLQRPAHTGRNSLLASLQSAQDHLAAAVDRRRPAEAARGGAVVRAEEGPMRAERGGPRRWEVGCAVARLRGRRPVAALRERAGATMCKNGFVTSTCLWNVGSRAAARVGQGLDRRARRGARRRRCASPECSSLLRIPNEELGIPTAPYTRQPRPRPARSGPPVGSPALAPSIVLIISPNPLPLSFSSPLLPRPSSLQSLDKHAELGPDSRRPRGRRVRPGGLV